MKCVKKNLKKRNGVIQIYFLKIKNLKFESCDLGLGKLPPHVPQNFKINKFVVKICKKIIKKL